MIVKFSSKLNADELKKLQAAVEDESFFDVLSAAKSAEEVQSILAEKDIHFTLAELEEVKKAIDAAANAEGELSETALEDVAGGGAFTLVSLEFKVKKVKVTVNIPW